MTRSRLMRSIRRLMHATRAADHSGTTARDLLDAAGEREEKGASASRRQVLRGLGAAAGAAVLAKSGIARAATSSGPRIAIIGGGIAGLNAALTLQDAGIASTIYEASGFVGGRIHSNATTWAEHQTSEWCGEFLDSGHAAMIALAQRFGLTLVDEIAAQAPKSSDTLYFFESYYGTRQAFKDFKAVSKQLEKDANDLYPTTYDPATQSPRAKHLDQMSAYQWIEQYVPGGHDSPLGAYIDSAYTNEFGLDTDQQSSLNVVYEMGFQPDASSFSIYGESDQRYHVLGGNDQIPRAIAAALPAGSVNTNWWMESIRRRADGTYALSFSTPGGNKSVIADHVIMTIPFGVLRGIDHAHAGFDALKETAICELGYGTNSKLMLQCTNRLWDTQGPWGLGDGSLYTDLYFQNAWDSSRGIPGRSGVLVAFMGGWSGLQLGGASSPFANADSSPQVVHYVNQFLQSAKQPWPGIEKLWNGRATLSAPWRAPNLLGSYSCWMVGQYTKFSGYEGVRQGNCHFAGEHCSNGFQGFMEGGATEGARAAQEIIADLA